MNTNPNVHNKYSFSRIQEGDEHKEFQTEEREISDQNVILILTVVIFRASVIFE